MKKALWVFAVVLFGCADNPPTIDGHTYKTVKIGDQEWFAENLKTTVYRNGDVIPANLSNDEWGSIEIGALAVYEGEILYNWYAVNDVRCLCPKGWHVPTDKEWTIMTDFLGGNEVAGEKMKTNVTPTFVSDIDLSIIPIPQFLTSSLCNTMPESLL